MTSAADTRHAILRNARAKERERLRNIAIRNHPELDAEQIEHKVRELELDKLREAGRRGRASQQRLADLGAVYTGIHPELEALARSMLDLLNSADPAVNDGEAA